MTQWIGSYLPLSLMAWDQFLEPRWWREDLSCPLISMWVESREYLSWTPWSTPHSSLLSSIFHFPPQARGPKLSTEWSRLPTVSLVYKIQRNFPAKNCSFIPGCDTLTPFRRLNTRLGCQGIHFWPLVSWGGDLLFTQSVQIQLSLTSKHWLSVCACVCVFLSTHLYVAVIPVLHRPTDSTTLSFYPSICNVAVATSLTKYILFSSIFKTLLQQWSPIPLPLQTLSRLVWKWQNVCVCMCVTPEIRSFAEPSLTASTGESNTRTWQQPFGKVH